MNNEILTFLLGSMYLVLLNQTFMYLLAKPYSHKIERMLVSCHSFCQINNSARRQIRNIDLSTITIFGCVKNQFCRLSESYEKPSHVTMSYRQRLLFLDQLSKIRDD